MARLRDGANETSLIESQQTYIRLGAMDAVFLKKVRRAIQTLAWLSTAVYACQPSRLCLPARIKLGYR